MQTRRFGRYNFGKKLHFRHGDNHVIQNNHSNPKEWNAEAISNHLNLRQAEVELFLSQFELVNEHAAFILSTQSDNTSDIFSVRHESFQDKESQ